MVITKCGNSLSISCFLAWVPSKSVQTKKFKHELHLAIKVQNLCSAQLSKFLAVRQFEPVLNGSVLVLFSSEKNLSVRFSVLKKWGENRTELNFGNTIRCSMRYFKHMKNTWVTLATKKPNPLPGYAPYAYKQAAMYEQFAIDTESYQLKAEGKCCVYDDW